MEYPVHEFLYTDTFKSKDKIGGAYIRNRKTTTLKLPDISSIFMAEASAIFNTNIMTTQTKNI